MCTKRKRRERTPSVRVLLCATNSDAYGDIRVLQRSDVRVGAHAQYAEPEERCFSTVATVSYSLWSS